MMEKIIMAGFGGQGVMLMGQMLAYSATDEGLHTVWIPSYGPETRGGTANCSVILATDPIYAPVVENPDVLMALNEPSLLKFIDKVLPGGTVFYNASLIDTPPLRDDLTWIGIDAHPLALELGEIKTVNMIMLGALSSRLEIIPLDRLLQTMKKTFSGPKAHLYPLNETALKRGREMIEVS